MDNVPGRDLICLRIRNTENIQDKVDAFSLRLRDQLKPDVVWGIPTKVIQSNARFGLSDVIEVHLHHVRMPVGNGKRAEKMKGRSLEVMSAIKKSVATLKTVVNCLVYALIIAMNRVNCDQNNISYSNGRGIRTLVEDLLEASGVDLSNGGGFREFRQFQEYLTD